MTEAFNNRKIMFEAFKRCYDERCEELENLVQYYEGRALVTDSFETCSECVKLRAEKLEELEQLKQLWQDTILGDYSSERHVVWLIQALCGDEPIKLSEEGD